MWICVQEKAKQLNPHLSSISLVNEVELIRLLSTSKIFKSI